MDPVSTAIIAAVSAGIVTGVGDAAKLAVGDLYAGGKQAIIDSYSSIKSLLRQKFGEQSEVVKSVNEFEANPKLSFKRDALVHYLVEAKVDEDAVLKKAAEDLLALLKTSPEGEQVLKITQNAIGKYIAQATNNSTATVDIDKTEK